MWITYFQEHHQVAALYLHVVGLLEPLLVITLITYKANISACFKNLIWLNRKLSASILRKN